MTSLTDEYTIFYTSQSKIQYFHVCFTERGDRRATAGELSGEERYEGRLAIRIFESREILLWKVVKCILKKG